MSSKFVQNLSSSKTNKHIVISVQSEDIWTDFVFKRFTEELEDLKVKFVKCSNHIECYNFIAKNLLYSWSLPVKCNMDNFNNLRAEVAYAVIWRYVEEELLESVNHEEECEFNPLEGL